MCFVADFVAVSVRVWFLHKLEVWFAKSANVSSLFSSWGSPQPPRALPSNRSIIMTSLGYWGLLQITRCISRQLGFPYFSKCGVTCTSQHLAVVSSKCLGSPFRHIFLPSGWLWLQLCLPTSCFRSKETLSLLGGICDLEFSHVIFYLSLP